jgi:3-oxoacyl-[acyl-carrier protein] reductase
MGVKKAALITGGSGGLGAAIARALGGAGYRVAVTYLHDRDGAEEAVRSLGEDASALKMDAGEAEDVRHAVAFVQKRWGRLDALINSAGMTGDALLVRLREGAWDEVIRVNLRGSFLAARESIPLMKAGGGGHIVNVSSRSGLSGKAGQVAYSASKAALFGLTRSLAAECAEANIRANALLPGYMPTKMGVSAGGAMDEALERSLLGKLSEPEEAASFILWLLSTTSVTGQVFVLDSRPAEGSF